MPDASALSAWITGMTGLVSAGAGAILTTAYRDYRDRAILAATMESFRRQRHPIRLPKELHAVVKPQGILTGWIDKIVKWEVKRPFDENRFALSELRDVHRLLPQFISVRSATLAEFTELRDSMQTPQNPPTDQQRLTLARLRAYWQDAFKEDVFVTYDADPQGTARKIINNFVGDIGQTTLVLEAAGAFRDWLDRGLAADAPAGVRISAVPKEPTVAGDPYVHVEVLVANTGKSETLIKDVAVFRCGALALKLKGYRSEYGFDVFIGKFWRVKPAAIEQLTFSQHPELTNLAQLQELRQIFLDRHRSGYVEIEDFRGRKTRTKPFVVRETEE